MYNKKHMARPVGRPTKYSEAVLVQLDDYLERFPIENTTGELPTMEGFALHIGVNTDTIQEWQKKHPEFSVSIKRLMHIQKHRLVNDGLYGGKEVNSTMAIFLLKANHGLIETEKQIHIGDKDNPLTVEYIE